MSTEFKRSHFVSFQHFNQFEIAIFCSLLCLPLQLKSLTNAEDSNGFARKLASTRDSKLFNSVSF